MTAPAGPDRRPGRLSPRPGVRAVRAPGPADRAPALWGGLSAADPEPGLVGVLDAALVLLADHELAASTVAARVAASVRADPYAVASAGLATVSGTLHGGASLGIEALLDEIDRPERAATVVGARLRRGERLRGFGHRLYPDGDPRARFLLTRLRATAAGSPRMQVVDALLEATTSRGLPEPNVDLALAALAHVTAMTRGSGEAIFASPARGDRPRPRGDDRNTPSVPARLHRPAPERPHPSEDRPTRPGGERRPSRDLGDVERAAGVDLQDRATRRRARRGTAVSSGAIWSSTCGMPDRRGSARRPPWHQDRARSSTATLSAAASGRAGGSNPPRRSCNRGQAAGRADGALTGPPGTWAGRAGGIGVRQPQADQGRRGAAAEGGGADGAGDDGGDQGAGGAGGGEDAGVGDAGAAAADGHEDALEGAVGRVDLEVGHDGEGLAEAAVGGGLGGAAGAVGDVLGPVVDLEQGQLLGPGGEQRADVVAGRHDRRPVARRRPARATTWPPSVASSSALRRSRARNRRTFTAPGVSPIAFATSSVDWP